MPRLLQLSVLLALGACMNAQSQPAPVPSTSNEPAKASSATAAPAAHDPLLDLPPLPKNKVKLTAAFKLLVSKGKQKPEHFVGGPVDVLARSVNGGPSEQSGLGVLGTLTNEEKLEINTVV